MKKSKDLLRTKWRSLSAVIALSACLFSFTACDKYDLDETTPEGWGASIYSYLAEDGHYKNTVRLIEDLDLKEVLAKTGSKTMFVADDDAFERFYSNNSWGVRNYDQLSLAQKKMLLLGAMINNSYQINSLSSIEGPVKGQCMRRLSSQTIYDTVSVVKVKDLPNMTPEARTHNTTWAKFDGRDNIVLMRDMTITPMIHFIEEQMADNKITNDDYNFLYNYTTERQAGDASVNGKKIVQQNIKCSNGFIHKVEDVVLPLQNMAELIASKPNVSLYNKLLERFCAPFYAGDAAVKQYNYLFNQSVDSIYQKRFFSEKSQDGRPLIIDDDNIVAKSYLKFDPEWNQYYSGLAIPSANAALEKNMAVMMVPSNAALENYWNNEAGKVLKDQYGSWDNVPNDVIVELINNNMLSSFVESVPSKFGSILNDANDPMGVDKADIDSVWLGCNGAVYLTNKVYSPTSFVSVLYPAIVNETMKVMRWAVEKNQYNVYLNSLNSRFSFFIPLNKAMLDYIDPASYGKTKTQLYRFHYDATKTIPVWASVYEYDMDTREIGDSIREERDEWALKSKLRDILDNHIVIGNVEDGNRFYKTKAGTEIEVANVSQGANGMTVAGSLQLDGTYSGPLHVSYIYDQTAMGNGKCYILDKEPIMTTRKSVFDVLSEHEEFAEMRKLIEGSSLLETIHDEKHACTSTNLNCFNTYHYTIYVPTNETILKLQEEGKLPTWEQVDNWEEGSPQHQRDSLAIENFIKCHIQDNALFIGAQPQEEDGYETAYIGESGKFDRVFTTLTKDDIIIKKTQTDTKPCKVIKKAGLYNIMAREYQLEGTDKNTATSVYTTSSAVIHLIDGSLMK
ncbi:MAG: fasciclin domain-containing protein [Prevotella sp.]|nr:fasciclin domain-containing protein [Prevotella sp.]MDY3965558.1 fasciclin domain-containing protein [Prevotella sp.]